MNHSHGHGDAQRQIIIPVVSTLARVEIRHLRFCWTLILII